MTIKGGTNKACAACKYQRRRCSKECILSPYFPSDQPKRFRNAHRLFGVSNIKTILKQVPLEQRDEAMSSIIFESDMRAKYPVEGCLGVARHYEYLVRKASEELQCVRMELLAYKNQFYHPRQISPIPPEYHSPTEYDSVLKRQQFQFGIPSFGDEILPIFNHNGDGVDAAYIEKEDNLTKKPSFAIDTQDSDSNNDIDLNATEAQSDSIEVEKLFDQQYALDIVADYDNIPSDAIADDKPCFIACKEAFNQSSAESSFQRSVSDNELENAAAFLRLTTLNDKKIRCF